MANGDTVLCCTASHCAVLFLCLIQGSHSHGDGPVARGGAGGAAASAVRQRDGRRAYGPAAHAGHVGSLPASGVPPGEAQPGVPAGSGRRLCRGRHSTTQGMWAGSLRLAYHQETTSLVARQARIPSQRGRWRLPCHQDGVPPHLAVRQTRGSSPHAPCGTPTPSARRAYHYLQWRTLGRLLCPPLTRACALGRVLSPAGGHHVVRGGLLLHGTGPPVAILGHPGEGSGRNLPGVCGQEATVHRGR